MSTKTFNVLLHFAILPLLQDNEPNLLTFELCKSIGNLNFWKAVLTLLKAWFDRFMDANTIQMTSVILLACPNRLYQLYSLYLKFNDGFLLHSNEADQD